MCCVYVHVKKWGTLANDLFNVPETTKLTIYYVMKQMVKLYLKTEFQIKDVNENHIHILAKKK